MIIFVSLRWRWLCWVGLHEYTTELLRTGRWDDYTCDVCGKRKSRVKAS